MAITILRWAGLRASLASGLFALACSTPHYVGLVPPQGCRASGLWVFERHPPGSIATYWTTIAMAPWESWAVGFSLPDGFGSSLNIRVTDVSGERIAVTAKQFDVDAAPAVLARGRSQCEFLTVGQPDMYRFRRTR